MKLTKLLPLMLLLLAGLALAGCPKGGKMMDDKMGDARPAIQHSQLG